MPLAEYPGVIVKKGKVKPENAMAKEIGAKLRQERQNVGLSLMELAVAAKAGFSHLAEIERGKRLPTLRTLNRLAVILGVDVKVTFGRRSRPPAT